MLRLNLKKKTGTSADGRRKDVKITLPLKYLTWSENCVLSNDTKGTIFAITDTKIDVPIATFWTQDNAKRMQELQLGLKKQLIGTNINEK